MIYPLDLLATLSSNYVETLYERPEGSIWTIVPEGGAFYTKDLIVTDTFTGKELTPVVDYVALETIPKAVLDSAKEVCGFIQIRNSVSLQVSVKRRIIGGPEYSVIGSDIQKLIDDYGLDDLTSTQWGQIIGKPKQYSPEQHTHLATEDVYGVQSLVYQTEAIKDAILTGDEAAFGMMFQYIDRLMAKVQSDADDRIKVIEDKVEVISEGIDFQVGQVIFFNDNTNPNGIHKGTWEALPEGVIMMSGDNEIGLLRKIGEGPDYVGRRFAGWVRVK